MLMWGRRPYQMTFWSKARAMRGHLATFLSAHASAGQKEAARFVRAYSTILYETKNSALCLNLPLKACSARFRGCLGPVGPFCGFGRSCFKAVWVYWSRMGASQIGCVATLGPLSALPRSAPKHFLPQIGGSGSISIALNSM